MMADFYRGLCGVSAPVLGVVTSLQEDLLWWLRVGSLLVGIAVGLLTIASILKGWRKQG